LLGELRNRRIRFANGVESKRAFEQLTALEPEQHETGLIYKCPPGQHDDLAVSLAMLAWAGKHAHLEYWTRPIFDAHQPRLQRQQFGWKAFT
jgi:hypothetical protein